MLPFKKGDQYPKRKKGGPFKAIFGFFRVCLSLAIMGVLLLGVYQAYKGFSGVDPLKSSPKAIVDNIIASEDFYGLITGLLSASPGESLNKAKQLLQKDGVTQPNKIIPSSSNVSSAPTAPLAFKFAIFTDSHNDNDHLKRALEMSKAAGAKFIVGLGDFTDVGTIDELRAAKLQLDTIGLPYYVTAGDHDLWDARNKKQNAIENFQEVFGTPYQSFAYQDLRVIIMYDADNYLGVDDFQQKWLEDEVHRINQEHPKLILVMTSTPLFHPSSDHQLGRVTAGLRSQADQLITLFKANGVKEVVAGDTHFYSSYTEPKSELKMTTVGAVTSTRNIQNPRFAIVEVYQDGSYNIQDTEIQ